MLIFCTFKLSFGGDILAVFLAWQQFWLLFKKIGQLFFNLLFTQARLVKGCPKNSITWGVSNEEKQCLMIKSPVCWAVAVVIKLFTP
jgi:hypothetical protein